MKLFQRRLKALRMQSPLDRWCAGAGAASAALGFLALIVIAAAESSLAVAGWIGIGGLFFYPRLLSRFRAIGEDGFGLNRESAAILLWTGVGVFLVLTLWAAPLIALIAWPHGMAVAHPRRDSSVALALTLGAAEGLMVAVLEPSLLGSALFALLLIVGTVGGTWLHARTTRRSFIAVADTSTPSAESPHGLTARSASVGILAALIILSIAVLEGGIAAVERADAASQVGTSAIAGHRPGGNPGSDSETATGQDSEIEAAQKARRKAERLRSYWPDSVILQGELQPGQERVMAEVACSLDRADPWHGPERPLYLRARTLDTLDPGGLRSSLQVRGDVLTDSGTGIEDGWVELVTPRSRQQEVIYAIRMRDHRVEESYSDRHLTTLLHTERLARVELPSIRVVADLGIYGEPPESGLLEYRWTAIEWNEELPIARPSEVDSRYLRIPNGNTRFQTWAAEGRALAEDAADRDEIVDRIGAHFADGWTYDLSPARDLHGIDALQQFFETRRGYCSFYASAALLYLRANRIPCRVVTGYRTTRFVQPNPDKRGYYKVYSSDAHAWVEIALADGNWRVFEPTPSQAYATAMAQYEGDDPKDFPADEPEVIPDPPAVVDGTSTRDRGNGWIPWWMPDGRSGFGYVIGIGVALLLQLLTMAHLRRLELMRLKDGESPEDHRAHDYWRRLVRVLRSYGFRPRRGQTPLEFAQLVRYSGGPLFAGIEPVVDTLYRRRFGHQELNALELQQLREYDELLRSEDFHSRWKEITGRGN